VAGTLKNLSAVPEVQPALAEEGIVQVMISLLDHGVMLGSKEYAAECLQNFTSSNDSLRHAMVSEGELPSLLAYLDVPLPQESAMGALCNFVSAVSPDNLVMFGVLRDGSSAAALLSPPRLLVHLGLYVRAVHQLRHDPLQRRDRRVGAAVQELGAEADCLGVCELAAAFLRHAQREEGVGVAGRAVVPTVPLSPGADQREEDPKISSCLWRTATYPSHRRRKSLLLCARKKEKTGKLVMERRIRSCSSWTSSNVSGASLAPRLMYTSSSNMARRNAGHLRNAAVAPARRS
jgi:hypothetical protein